MSDPIARSNATPCYPHHRMTTRRADAPSTKVTDEAVVGFVLEQALGHITHAANLKALVPTIAKAHGIAPVFLPVEFEPGRAARVPGWSNWTIRAGVRARRALRSMSKTTPPDALFIHTQVPAILLGRYLRRQPAVVSLDATPQQYDDMGEAYGHTPGPAFVERVKHRMHRHAFHGARHLVTWSGWARDDLVKRYGIDPSAVTVVPPGVDVERWQPSPRDDDDDRPLEVLFVGGDLARKGGHLLIEACDQLRADGNVPDFVLHIVTGAAVESRAGLEVHRGLAPNSPALVDRFRSADIFCLPTFGDALALVLAEAGAAGLPLVSTPVGGVSDIVRPGVTGELVPPGNVEELAKAIGALLCDPDRRRRYGAQARQLVEREHNAAANADVLLTIIRETLDQR